MIKRTTMVFRHASCSHVPMFKVRTFKKPSHPQSLCVFLVSFWKVGGSNVKQHGFRMLLAFPKALDIIKTKTFQFSESESFHLRLKYREEYMHGTYGLSVIWPPDPIDPTHNIFNDFQSFSTRILYAKLPIAQSQLFIFDVRKLWASTRCSNMPHRPLWTHPGQYWLIQTQKTHTRICIVLHVCCILC